MKSKPKRFAGTNKRANSAVARQARVTLANSDHYDKVDHNDVKVAQAVKNDADFNVATELTPAALADNSNQKLADAVTKDKPINLDGSHSNSQRRVASLRNILLSDVERQDKFKVTLANQQLTNDEASLSKEMSATLVEKAALPQEAPRILQPTRLRNNLSNNDKQAVLNYDFAKQRKYAKHALEKLIMPESPSYDLPENYTDFDPEKVAVPNRVDIHPAKSENHFLTELFSWLKYILSAFIIAFLFVTFIAQRNIVDGNSMYPTLHNGDNLIVEKVSNYFSLPARGTIVTFIRPKLYPTYEKEADGQMHKTLATDDNAPDTHLVKRVIGLPGDEVEIKNGRVYVNGKELSEPYLATSIITSEDFPEFAHVKLADDELYVMGDNRPHSSDSRSFGPIKIKSLVGRSIYRFYPFDRMGVTN